MKNIVDINGNEIKRISFRRIYEWGRKNIAWILAAIPLIGSISTVIFNYGIRIWMGGKAKYFHIPEEYIVI